MEISIANLVRQHWTKLLKEVHYLHKKEYVMIKRQPTANWQQLSTYTRH